MKVRNLFFGSLVAFLLSGCIVIDPRAFFTPTLTEVVVEEDAGWWVSDKILLVDISGIISESLGGLLGGELTCTPAYFKTVLRRAEEDPNIRAVVLRIESPGGTVAATEQMASELRAFRKRTGLPVYAHIQGVGCSGAYYLAAGCDAIRIQPAGITGSIGVIAVLPHYQKLADKVGYEEQVFKSGALKDLGSGMREMTDEEKKVFQALIDESYAGFVDWILAHRGQVGDRAQLIKLADGRIYTARQALDAKLVDGISFLAETLDAAKTAARITCARVVTYSYTGETEPNIYSPAAAARTLPLIDAKLPAPLRTQHAGVYYLWRPGE